MVWMLLVQLEHTELRITFSLQISSFDLGGNLTTPIGLKHWPFNQLVNQQKMNHHLFLSINIKSNLAKHDVDSTFWRTGVNTGLLYKHFNMADSMKRTYSCTVDMKGLF